MTRIAIVTDAWFPQENGVVRVLASVRDRLVANGHTVGVLSPEGFRTMPCPTYPQVPLALFPGRRVAAWLDDWAPQAIHIATEGPLGWAARGWCLRRGRPFTTAFHTQFPAYVAKRTGLPLAWPYALMRRFHAPSHGVMVPSPGMLAELDRWGFANLREWTHGVDTRTFHPRPKTAFAGLARPVFLYVGRVTVDKNLPAFLDLDLPGSKVVVGGGPSREALMRDYPAARFLIARGDEELAAFYASADAFVFPSRTDTFGLVMLESLACGVPVAAFPEAGPLAVIGQSEAGVLDPDLRRAALAALDIPAERCVAHAARFSWDAVAEGLVRCLAI
ncbi:MAG: glycosyltransferase family 1 protein [Alphaproteobacteria bacterium]|nr:glycosyltransferase family 1 protein [Alphaproteobacteria bacterium]MBF0375705.1 glycosyltransferase family 1 protein [Alphaproteobacteria bacterium]